MKKKLIYVCVLLLFFVVKHSALFVLDLMPAGVELFGGEGDKDLPDDEKRVQFEFSEDFLHVPETCLHCVFLMEKVYVGRFDLAAAPLISLPYPPPDPAV